MKLDRNITSPRRGKYALIKLRTSTINPALVHAALSAGKPVEVEPEAIDFGNSNETDFFVIRLKDKYAAVALKAYADAAWEDGETEFAQEIDHLSTLAQHLPFKQKPD